MAARRKKAGRRRRTKAQDEFVSEGEEILERMRGDLSLLMDEREAIRDAEGAQAGEGEQTGEVDPELLNRIFRAAHSLKGLSGMFGLESLSLLAHSLEDVLDGLRLGRVPLHAPAVDLLDEALVLFATLLEQVGADDFESTSSGPIANLVARIESEVAAPPSEENDFAELDLDPALLRALTEYEEHRLRENLRRGRHLSLVDTSFEIVAFEEGLTELSAAIRELGEVVSTLPSPGNVPEAQIRFSLLVATEIDAETLSSRLESRDTTVRAVGGGAPARGPAAEGKPAASEAPASASVVVAGPGPGKEPPPEAIESAAVDAAPGSLRSISDTVRVDIKKLDELMNLVGELVIQRASISDIAGRLAAEPSTARIGDELGRVHKLLDRKLRDLQSGVLDVRMVPLRQVFEKLARVVRGLRRDLGKEVALDFSGADTELDKLIVEQLIDPLMHVVRNAFDHAIEPEAERRAAHKEARGKICIAASQRGNHVVIEVSDDGRGIDVEAVRRAAERQGLCPGGGALSDKEILDLVFAPGFSTRETVTETSGRGVGMDVVRTNLAAMGGMVEIDTLQGHGTTVTLTLPITLAIMQALLVGVGDQRFAIPLNSVLETLHVETDTIQRSEGRELLNLRGEALPLRRLAEEFEIRPGDDTGQSFVVVLGLGERRMGLLVDRLEGQQDTVIKPIQGPIPQVRGIAGATEQADRGAILVIDVSSIVDDTMRRRDAA